MTTLPLASSAASAWPDRALAWANAAASSAPLSRARWRRIARTPLTAFDSHPAACAGRLWRHVETSRTATASSVTGSRTATPPQTHSSKPVHQCSGPLISTGPGASSAVPIPLVPVAHSDQHDHGAMLDSRAWRSVFTSPWIVRIRPDAVGDRDHAAEVLDLGRDRRGGAAEVGEHDLVLERVLGRGLVADGRRRGPDEARVDVVLLAAAVPGRGHLGPHPAHPVVAGEKAFASGGHRAVPLAVADAMTLAGPAHPRRSLRWLASSAPRSALLRKRRL